MGIDFTVYKGSKDGSIVEAKGHRDVGPTEALVELSHCGVCGTDEHYRHYEMGLGHEGIGRISELGPGASRISDLKVGDRVGFGWVQKNCGYCKPCLTGAAINPCDSTQTNNSTGQDIYCLNQEAFGNANLDEGGFGTAVARDVTSLTKIPDEISSEHAGPLMCAGATVWYDLSPHLPLYHLINCVIGVHLFMRASRLATALELSALEALAISPFSSLQRWDMKRSFSQLQRARGKKH
jgi:D-arabinose 1-dehydrogenase-like Zn-dependent alcohol dehydrogenase